MTSADPFRHHPRLRGLITPPETSYFRTFNLGLMDQMLARHGLPSDWRRSDEDLESSRRAALGGREGALWIFGYGSLMWDPGVHFAEVRRARVEGYARRFCLVDTIGGRGTPQQPGIMAGLDTGPYCDGLAFRIAAQDIEAEIPHVWNREMCVPAYSPAFVPAQTRNGPIEALTFVADHGSPTIRPDLSRAEQVRYAATGEGFLGTSLDYVANLAAHFEALDIDDPDVTGLLAEARAYRAATG